MNKGKLGIGLLILVVSSITAHYFNIPDFLSGALQGFAAGIMILALLKFRENKKQHS